MLLLNVMQRMYRISKVEPKKEDLLFCVGIDKKYLHRQRPDFSAKGSDYYTARSVIWQRR